MVGTHEPVSDSIHAPRADRGLRTNENDE